MISKVSLLNPNSEFFHSNWATLHSFEYRISLEVTDLAHRYSDEPTRTSQHVQLTLEPMVNQRIPSHSDIKYIETYHIYHQVFTFKTSTIITSKRTYSSTLNIVECVYSLHTDKRETSTVHT